MKALGQTGTRNNAFSRWRLFQNFSFGTVALNWVENRTFDRFSKSLSKTNRVLEQARGIVNWQGKALQ
jgi:hypothetical protein